jgi:hypothetical protein
MAAQFVREAGLARRERPKYANAALQFLKREQPIPADCAMPWRVWGALSSIGTCLAEY